MNIYVVMCWDTVWKNHTPICAFKKEKEANIYRERKTNQALAKGNLVHYSVVSIVLE